MKTPVASLIVDGALWIVEDLHCGYLATCSVTHAVVASETYQGLVDAVCDEMGVERVDLTVCSWSDVTPTAIL